MKPLSDTSPLRVVIAGGGVAALEAMLALRHLAEDRVSIELLAQEDRFWYRPLSVAEPFGLGTVHGLDLGELADESGALLTIGALEAVDVERGIARTAGGAEIEYDALLLAVGAHPVDAVPGAFTFRGLADTIRFQALLAEMAAGFVENIAFVVPSGVAWPLPLYELALQTATYAREQKLATEIIFVTHEEAPLDLFGPPASSKVRGLLADRGIRIVTGTYAVAFADGLLSLRPGGSVAAERVVALPRLEGPALHGVPHDARGFVPTDSTGRVRGLAAVFAAGDATTFPVKQGGLAAQQADAAAESIAEIAGAELTPEPFRPVLRGLILTGSQPFFARAELTSTGDPFTTGMDALWWPPGKIVGRYLAPFLAERSRVVMAPPESAGVVKVDVELAGVGGPPPAHS
jgi:sulfide:quinone oxidoreductase